MTTTLAGNGKVHEKKKPEQRGKNRLAQTARDKSTKAKSGDKLTTVKIKPLNIGRMTLNLRGTSPLMVHNFDDKSRRQMLEAQTKTKKAAKEPRCPTEEFLGAFYLLDDAKLPQPTVNDETKEKSYDPKVVAKFLKDTEFVVPITGFKNAIIAACRNSDFTMTQMRQSLFVTGAKYRDWAVIEGCIPQMDSRICRLAGAAKTPIERFRPRWDEWGTQINFEWDANLMTADQVANLVSIAGFYCGVFEARPSCSAIGYGRFEIVE